MNKLMLFLILIILSPWCFPTDANNAHPEATDPAVERKKLFDQKGDSDIFQENHFNITSEGAWIPLSFDFGEVLESGSFEDKLFWVDQEALDNGIVEVLSEDLDQVPENGTPILVDGATIMKLSPYPLITTNSFYQRSGTFIIRMTCTPGSNCTKTLTFSNFGGAAGSVTFSRQWGTASFTRVPKTGCSGSGSGSNVTLTLSPGASCQVNVSALMPSGYAQYWNGAVVITGVNSPTSGYFDICMSDGNNYCN